MSEEEKELLARIEQLAGQINRHKNKQAGVSLGPNRNPIQHRRNAYRQASAPYPSARHPTAHRHRTLNLNAGTASGSDSDKPGWVTKNDRHRQLINANIYEKERESRSKALEHTRDNKRKQQGNEEKQKFEDFLKRRTEATASSRSATAALAPGQNEIIIEGIRFCVMDGGKKLKKVQGDINSVSSTPRTTNIAGVKFYRTKTGNLIANRVMREHRQRGAKVKKSGKICRVFSTTGSCPKGPSCRHLHDPNKVSLCKSFLRDRRCPNGDGCDLSHEMTPERTPNCLHYAKGHCGNAECPFTHSKAPPSALVCEAFGVLGYCEKGAECTERHVFECPEFSNTGRCRTKGCKLPHRERASVLRSQARGDEDNEMEDVSSDDEDSTNSDDVDSDEVAEFVDNDSDVSETENSQSFIRL